MALAGGIGGELPRQTPRDTALLPQRNKALAGGAIEPSQNAGAIGHRALPLRMRRRRCMGVKRPASTARPVDMVCAIAVMAKAPRPGFCKTRLVPSVTPEQAASLSRAFLRDITDNLFAAAAAVPIQPYVAFAPAGLEHLFDGVLAPGTKLILADGSGDMPDGVTGFGRALLHAIRALLASGASAACVLNADSPTLPTACLRRAAALLAQPGDRVVMGPAEDGGYTLLGMKSAHAALFADIAWSTDAVADQTRKRARDAGLAMVELRRWYDVDDADSLKRLRAERRHQAYPAPFTRAALEQIHAEELGGMCLGGAAYTPPDSAQAPQTPRLPLRTGL
jgi:rSAM/selenodomain-associated transferase 1